MMSSGVEVAAVGEALGEAEHHLGGVGRLARGDVVAAPADHLGDDAVALDDLVGGEELGGRAQGLADGEAEQRAPEAVLKGLAVCAGRHDSRSRATRSKNRAW